MARSLSGAVSGKAVSGLAATGTQSGPAYNPMNCPACGRRLTMGDPDDLCADCEARHDASLPDDDQVLADDQARSDNADHIDRQERLLRALPDGDYSASEMRECLEDTD